MSILSDARMHRAVMEQAVQSLDNNTALTVISFHPEWSADTAYTKEAGRPVGYKIQHGGKLWKLRSEHTSLAHWEPGATSTESLWEEVNETHSGELTDPIPYNGNMALEKGKHYIQNGTIYLCIRDTVNPVYNPLAELVGLYVEPV